MRLLLILSLVIAALALPRPTAVSAEPNVLTGSLPGAGGGIGLAVWGGGTAASVATAASMQGCTAAAIWLSAGGTLVGNVFGAPALVNAAFVALYPNSIPANTPIIVVCKGPTPPPPPPVSANEAFDRDMRQMMTEGINRERTSRGLSAFSESAILVATAQKYTALHLSIGLPLNHEVDGTEPWDRAKAQGYPTLNVSEVLVGQQQTRPITAAEFAPNFVQRLMDSPPHREILLSPNQTQIGVGCALGKDSGGLNLAICAGVTGKP